MLTVRAGAAALAAACIVATVTVLGTAQPAVAQYKLTEATVVRISLPDLKKQMAAGTVVVVDVRDANGYAQGHIPGAWLIPVDQAAQRAADLKKLGKLVVTYCS